MSLFSFGTEETKTRDQQDQDQGTNAGSGARDPKSDNFTLEGELAMKFRVRQPVTNSRYLDLKVEETATSTLGRISLTASDEQARAEFRQSLAKLRALTKARGADPTPWSETSEESKGFSRTSQSIELTLLQKRTNQMRELTRGALRKHYKCITLFDALAVRRIVVE